MKKILIIILACILLVINFPVDTMAANQENQIIEDSITDVNGETFKIARPNPNTINKVNAAQFGLSPENDDNYTAFSSAIAYCKEHPNTYLEINKGIYHFRTEKDINLNGLNNILIDGNGSEFIFSTPKYFKINQCNSLEIRELAIDWDWESSRLASLVKIYKCNKNAKTFEIEFTELDDVDVDIPIICFMQFDKDTLTPGSYGGYKTFYPDQVVNGIVKREKVAPNRIKLYFGQESYMNSFHDEEVYLIRHYTYGGRVFQPSRSENITFDDIHIYSAAGMGYIISDKTKYFQIINSSIGRRTDRADAPYISTTADGIHILNTSGYFRIENCDFSFTGDDIMNIHDDVMSFTRNENGTVFKGKVTGAFAGPGDKVKFKNTQMGPFKGCEDYEVEVESFSRNAQTNEATITFKTSVNSAIGNEGFIYRSSTSTSNYVIKNNYIHETKGRGMLLLGSNALIENNELYRTVSEGIHVLADVDPNGLGSGGYGPSNVVIRGNTLTECTVSNKMPVVMVRYKNGEKISKYKDVLKNIKIENNKFIGCFNYAIEADNVTNLIIKNNIIQDCDNRNSDSVSSKNISIGNHCDNVINEGNDISTTTHTDNHDVILIQGRAPSCISYGMEPIQYCNDCHRKLTEVIGIKPIDHKFDGEFCSFCGAANPDYKPNPVTVKAEGIYEVVADKNHYVAGMVVDSSDKFKVEYSWWANKDDGDLVQISEWKLANEWIDWTPDEFGDYTIVGKARSVGNQSTEVSLSTTYSYHPHIKGKCQMPYEGEGGGYLIGFETYDNLNNACTYEMLILDCTLLAAGKDAWIYTTTPCHVEGKALWTIWQPQYGYYWTLFRFYDAAGKLIDQECYGFVNAY